MYRNNCRFDAFDLSILHTINLNLCVIWALRGHNTGKMVTTLIQMSVFLSLFSSSITSIISLGSKNKSHIFDSNRPTYFASFIYAN